MTARSRQPARDRAGTASGKSIPGAARASGRHPAAERTVVRFTDAALGDLELMARKGDPQVVRWAVKKCLLLERDPEAGEPLRGALIGYRKLAVGDRDWRIVWRVTHDDAGRPVVDVAEVWALGARSDSEVHAEMTSRVAALSATPATVPLAQAIERLGKAAAGIHPASAEPATGVEPDGPGAQAVLDLPRWLAQSLIKVVGLPPEQVAQLSEAEAHRRWNEFISAPH
ncbi:type II toxin-antitoxin system RelE family toxin [Modestobacter sp. SSW1-42]|uniref:type II toxin-antitoxin system RelE family toxin n=1 Tax=Modestobacter sp. SSW1-42 TaxID=596372 RepID=UPI0039886D0D